MAQSHTMANPKESHSMALNHTMATPKESHSMAQSHTMATYSTTSLFNLTNPAISFTVSK